LKVWYSKLQPMASRLTYRSEEIEIMDDLESGGPIMDQTLRELEVINKWLGGNYVTIDGLNKLLRKQPAIKRVKIVDIGCGGGDMLKLVAKWARKNDLEADLVGIDANPHVINFAEKNTAEYQEISFKAINIFSEEFKELEADIFIATLFTHHFKDDEFISLLNQLKSQAQIGLVINDLHRHWFAYHSIKWLTTLFSKSEMVRNDAAVSVSRSFLKHELLDIMAKSNINNYSLKWMWAFRWQVVADFLH